MPEGQSLALAAERLRPLVGEAVTEGALRGARIEAVESHGKQLLIRSDDGRTLRVLHFMHPLRNLCDCHGRFVPPEYR